MENATKALIIAGGILLGILILSIGVYVILQFSNFSESIDDKVEQDRKLAFNNKFLVYAKDLTPQEMVSLINLVTEENNNNPDLKMEIYVYQGNVPGISTTNYLELSEDDKINLMKSDRTFYYSKTIYNNSTGFVKKIEYSIKPITSSTVVLQLM